MTVTKIGSFDFDKKIKALRREKVKLPKIIGEEAVNHFKRGFKKNGGQTNSSIGGWKKRKFPRVTKSGKISGSTTSNILVKKGNLRKSVRRVKTTWNNITIASNLPYSEIHNEGGNIRQVVTAKQATFLGHLGANLKSNGNILLGNAYSRMANARVLNIDIPKREFIGRSRVLERKIVKLIDREYLNILRK